MIQTPAPADKQPTDKQTADKQAAFIRQLTDYLPFNEQEAQDKRLILDALSQYGERLYLRENLIAHLSASAWIVNPARDKVLLAWHNLFRAWSWLGGHADGEADLLQVALREAREESGIEHVRAVSDAIFSIEVLTVDGHEKRGVYVPSHLHLNVTYLLEADEHDALHIKPDENSGVAWFPLEESAQASSEEWMRTRIYEKLNKKLGRQI